MTDSLKRETDGGNGQDRSEIKAKLDKGEDPQDLARQYLDDDGKYRVDKWLKGDLELDDVQVQNLIAKLPILDYGRRRKDIAKKLGISLGMLDQLRRGPAVSLSEDTGQGTAVQFEDPEPWPEEVDGAVLLDDLATTFLKYIVLPDGGAEALSLWTAFTYVHDKFQISPILSITSPDKRCGKTTLLALLGQLVLKPMPASNVTASTIFRGIERFHPTLLIDEADTFMKENEELRGVLNSGHLRAQAQCIRCVGEENEVKIFSTWCPKAIAKIGKLSATLDDRSIEISMQRKTPDEIIERLRLDRAIDLKELFEQQEEKHILSSSFIVERLGELEHRPWPEYRRGKPISTHQLAHLIKKYGVGPRTKWIDGKVLRGYLLSDLEPLFIRYTTKKSFFSGTPLQSARVQGKGANLQPEKELDALHFPCTLHSGGVQSARCKESARNKNDVNSLPEKDLFSDLAPLHSGGGGAGKENLLYQLKTCGFALVHSEILGEDVFVTDGEHWPTEEKSGGHVVYTFDEMAMLRDESPERIRTLHIIKRAFDGQIVR